MADPWAFWPPADIARITGCPEPAVRVNWPLIAAALDRRGIYDRAVCLGVLPTVAIETARTFEPVREAYWLPEEWRRTNLRYYPFFGRGFIQLTWESGYRDAGEALGVNLLSYPDKALDPQISADILAWFWATKGVKAKDGSRWYSLSDLCRDRDWPWVRKVVQGGADGLDRLIAMASALDALVPSTPIKEPILVAANDAYRVADGPARLRSDPSTSATIVQDLPTGTTLVDVGDPLVDADGHQWRRVALGPVGWMADELLAPADNVTDPPPDDGKRTQLDRYTFDPSFPTQLQRQDWTCSIRSVMMLLDSIGIAVTAEEAQDAMSPAYVNSAVGLLDASGGGIVEVLAERWGVEAVNFGSLSFDEAMSMAGTGPLAIGLRNWGGPHAGHWSAVRGKSGDSLVLANPAQGTMYGQQTLNRQEYDARGPASGVFIPLAA